NTVGRAGENRQSNLRITSQRHGCRVRATKLSRVDVKMNELRTLGNVEQCPASGIDVGEMRSHADKDVTTTRRSICLARARTPDAAALQWLIFRKGALAGSRHRNRDPGLLRELHKLAVRARVAPAAPDHQQRTFR